MGFLLYKTTALMLLFFLIFHRTLFSSVIQQESDSSDLRTEIVQSDVSNLSDKTETVPENVITSISAASDLEDSLPDKIIHSRLLLKSAFHPPLEDSFWNLLAHNQQYGAAQGHIKDLVQMETITKDGAKIEEDMPSFEEWRQEKIKLAEKERSDQAVSNSSSAKKRQRIIKNTNKALTVCGAKVIAHNPEVENPNAVLTSNPDEYMLIPCKAPRKFFILELCESVRIQSIEIGNLELFSNVPKVIQVAGSSRFPTRDWVDLGRFDMAEMRTIQNFTIDSVPNFMKFLKVEYLEHYGKEHYCPISTIRVFGTGMVDEYIESVDDDDEDQLENTHAVPTSVTEPIKADEDAYMEDDKWGRTAVQPSNPITLAKDLIVTYIKTAASNGYNLLHGNSKNSTPAPCTNASAAVLDLDANRSVYENRSDIHAAKVSATSPLLRLCLNKSQDVSSVTCQYIWCLLQASNSSLSFCPDAEFLNQNNIFQVDSVVEIVPDCDKSSSVLGDSKNLTPGRENSAELPLTMQVNIISENEKATATSVPPVDLELLQMKPNEAASLNVSSSTAPTHEEPVNSVSANRSPEPEIKANETTAPLTSNPPGQKESVFVRLGNRLKILERNMTLSGQYLQELSRRFKKQGEDSAKNFSFLFTKLSETMKTAADHRTLLAAKVEHVQSLVAVLSSRVNSLEAEVYYFRWILPGVALVVVCIIALSMSITFLVIYRGLKRNITLEAGRLLSHHASNGFTNGSVMKGHPVAVLHEPGRAGDASVMIIPEKSKKIKKRRRTKFRLWSFARLVPS